MKTKLRLHLRYWVWSDKKVNSILNFHYNITLINWSSQMICESHGINGKSWLNKESWLGICQPKFNFYLICNFQFIKFFFIQTLILLTYVQLTNGQSKMHFCQAPSESPNDGGNLIKAPSTVFVKSRMALFFNRWWKPLNSLQNSVHSMELGDHLD